MAGYDLGTARGEIVIDYRGDGTKKAESDLDRFGSKTKDTNKALDDVGRTTQRAGLAIAAGIGVAVASAANFESKMSDVKAVSGASASEMDGLAKKALQLGADTKFSASEAATAIEELVKAGISVPDVMNGAADATVALAAAGELELPRAAEIAANAMNQFKLSAEDMPRVANLLAGAANASAIDVNELGESLKFVGPVAQAAGVSLEDTATALAILGNAGIKGSSAGTALRQVFARLEPPTKKARDAMKELGLVTKDGGNQFFDAKGKMKPLADVVQILHDRTKDLSRQEKITFAKKAFGLESMPAALILMGETAATIDEMTGALNKTTAADVAATRMDNLKGSLEQLKGSLETFLIIAGTPALKALRDLVDGLTGLVNAFMTLSPETRKVIGVISVVAAAFLLIVGTVMRVIAFVGRFIEALRAIPGAMAVVRFLPRLFAVLLGPIGAIIAAIITLGIAAYQAYQKFAPFRELVNSVAATVRDVLVAAFQGVVSMVQTIIAGFQGASGASGFVGFLQGVGNAARMVWDALKQLWAAWQTNVLPILRQAGVDVWNTLKTAWAQIAAVITGTLWPALQQLWVAFAPIRSVLATVLPFILKLIGAFLLLGPAIMIGVVIALAKLLAFLAPVAAAFVRVAAVVIGVLIQAFVLIATVIVTVISAIIRVVAAIVSIGIAIATFVAAALAKWVAFWAQFTPIVQAVWRLIVAIVKLGIALIQLAIAVGLAIIRAVWAVAWRGLMAVVRPIWAAIRAVIAAAMAAIRAVISAGAAAARAVIVAVWRAITGNTSATWSSIRTTIANAWNQIVSKVRSAVDSVITTVRTIKGRVTSALAGAASWLVSAGKNIVQGLINGITSMIGKVTSVITELAGKVKAAAAAALKIGSPSKVFEDLGVFTIEGYIKGLENMATPLVRTVDDTIATTPNAAMAGIVNGMQQPQVSVAPPKVVLPEKMILRVGDREFTAYVKEQADSVLSDAASKIGRGRK